MSRRAPRDTLGLVTVKYASQLLQYSTRTIYRLGHEGKLDLVKLSDRSTRVTEASLRRLLSDIARMPVSR